MTAVDTPLVSVIMPIYNHEAYVTQALDSILNQTYPNLEIIIIDDGSKDASCTKVSSALTVWKDLKQNQLKRDIQFIKQENCGAHETINRGLSLATGEWLTILNSDDYYHPDRILTLIQQTRAAKAEFAFTYVVGVDSKNQLLPPDSWWCLWYERARFQLFATAPTVGFQLLEHNLAVSTGNLFFQRCLYEQVGPFKNLKLAHDLDFILRSLTLTEPLLVRENHYFYRLHGHNTQYQVQHLMESEIREIYREYLYRTFPKPPKNPQAPSHWAWPSEFAKWRLRLKMDRGLSSYIIKNSVKPLVAAPFPIKIITNKHSIPITLISHELSLSGAPKLIADLALCLSKQGFNPKVIALYDGPMKQELEKNNIPVYVLARRWKILSLLRLLQAFYLCSRGRVIANSIMSWHVVLPLTILFPWKKPIWYIHESFTPLGVLKGIHGKLAAFLINWSKKISPPQLWFGSSATRKSWAYSSFPQGKVMYWSGIPKQSIKRKSKSHLKHLLSVGTASSRKGTHILIDAFLLCLETNRIPKDTNLTIVGFSDIQGPDANLLGDIILKSVTSKHKDLIHIVGAVEPEHLEPFFQQADIFIQSSVLECMPIALLTAMSQGLPIITTNVDGCAEAITGVSGNICLPYDVGSLADAIAQSVNNPQDSLQMGMKAQETFNAQFSLEVTLDLILKELTN